MRRFCEQRILFCVLKQNELRSHSSSSSSSSTKNESNFFIIIQRIVFLKSNLQGSVVAKRK
jgi:hypothetical protein